MSFPLRSRPMRCSASLAADRLKTSFAEMDRAGLTVNAGGGFPLFIKERIALPFNCQNLLAQCLQLCVSLFESLLRVFS